MTKSKEINRKNVTKSKEKGHLKPTLKRLCSMFAEEALRITAI